jgi:hypothetical protein
MRAPPALTISRPPSRRDAIRKAYPPRNRHLAIQAPKKLTFQTITRYKSRHVVCLSTRPTLLTSIGIKIAQPSVRHLPVFVRFHPTKKLTNSGAHAFCDCYISMHCCSEVALESLGHHLNFLTLQTAMVRQEILNIAARVTTHQPTIPYDQP